MIPGYTTLSTIGRGAGSSIHQVRHIQTGKIFALKQVKKQDDPEGRFFEQIEVEYEVGRSIAHPALRKIYDLQRSRKRFRVIELHLLMEYLDGLTLEQADISGIPELVRIFEAVGQGLQAMHQAGFLHADIKPSNIMICDGLAVKIFDLGQSCKLGSTKKRIQGTPDFIAPEQVMKLPVDQRTDVFNLGATMYWCLTGQAFPTKIKGQQKAGAFDISSPLEVETPQERNSNVPKILSDVVMDCCRNSPANRLDMHQVLKKLHAVAQVMQITQN